ncbi:hypothetical protein CKG00_16055 (plasmid) [Morganella morganii]|uniref:Uncharacterized protein n=1 Tax=Morganella morganii TaxID=582 RepID=A0A433ZRC6_MORMO|nr:hypothetical protein CKG00_16055 [Morganella morganii]
MRVFVSAMTGIMKNLQNIRVFCIFYQNLITSGAKWPVFRYNLTCGYLHRTGSPSFAAFLHPGNPGI